MKILFVASEVDPIIKVGGVADVVSSLSKELKNAGEDIRVIVPLYQPVREKFLNNFKKAVSFEVVINNKKEKTVIWEGVLPEYQKKLKIYLIENNNYLSNKGVYLSVQDFSYLTRFLFFSKAVVEFLKIFSWKPDLVHCHDWQAGLLPLLFKIDKSFSVPVLFTIHNLLIQGEWDYNKVLKFLGLKGNENFSLKYKTKSFYGVNFNVLQQAILNADLISVVSPTYADEIRNNPYYSRGLDSVIQKRKNDLIGILNGIDVKDFNPQTDPLIKKNYSASQIELKKINKKALLKKVGLKAEVTQPLLGLVSRLDEQKGVDLLCQIVDNLIELGVNMVFLGKGEEKYEKMLKEAARKFSNNISTLIKFDAALARQIYAGADIFLMPSRFEPCGLSQLIAMRYGAVPIVRGTGGLLDTVDKVRIKKGILGKKTIQGTGFVFNDFSKEEFLKEIKQALKIYHQKEDWKKIVKNAMKADFSWRKSTNEYLKLYKRLIKKQ